MFQVSPRLLIVTAFACSHPPAKPVPPPATTPPSTESKPPPDPYAAIDEAGKAITADALRDQITKISSDEFEGRGPTTKADQAARAYLISQLKAMGYEPGAQGERSETAGGGDKAWEQPVELV